ncbi:MAG: NTP transferase domain-containing protein, partial [Rhodomicrobium sp.]|nr:NTP transferase domain-containing protein [Rhodomicrobium sp.]
PVIADATADYSGPLAGVLAGMRWAADAAPEARFIVTAACDTPFFPKDLVTRLFVAAEGAYPAIVLAMSEGQIHPVFGLWPVALAGDLADALASGTRKVLHWTDRHPNFTANFPAVSLGGKLIDPFFNANTPEELEEAAMLLAAEGTP